ncbi:MAG: glycosyltransferase family 39 protein [Anaerolineales bacterium]
MQVVQLMLASSRLPQKQDCWECFQPKLFHFTVTKVVQVLGLSSLSINGLSLVAEIINLLAGLVTLAVAWVFIVRLPVKNKWLKLLAFGLVALNPVLIGINSQATNDTFAILFSTLAIYCTYVFLQRKRIAPFLLAILFAALGIASKTNAWVTAIVIVITLFIQTLSKPGRYLKSAIDAIAFLFAVLLLSVVNPLTQYVTNYEEYGKPVLMNINTLPLPPLVGITKYNDRGGILSIRDGFFTFKFINLLEHPRIDYEHDNYPPNRTSFWTMLYASANSASFSNYPPSWTTSGTQGFLLDQGIFILAILPFFLLLMGGLMETFVLLRGIFRRDSIALQNTSYGLFSLTFIGYIAFAILYALLYQTFLVLKAIFIFPALLVFPLLFLRTAEPAYAFLFKRLKWSVHILDVDIIALVILYIMDIVMIIIRIHLYH